MTLSRAVRSPLAARLLAGPSLWVFALAILSVGCAAPDKDARRAAKAIAIVSVVAADGVETTLSNAAMMTQLERALIAAEAPAPLSNSVVGRQVGGERLAGISVELARHGRLSSESLQALMATPLTARRGLLVRLERNEVSTSEPEQIPARDGAGRPISDRHELLLSRRRDMRIAATLLDLNTGLPIWQRAWTAAPEASVRYVNYSGSSFTGSVAATLANSVVNGLRVPQAPAAPNERVTLEALLQQLAAELPR